MISNLTEPYIRFCVVTYKFQLKNAVQYWTDFKDHITLHPLWEHWNPKWKRQFSIEIISKMTEHYILCGDIQIPTEKDSSVFKWFQIWRNLTSFVGTFKFQTEKDSSVLKWLQRWQNLTFFVGTFKFRLKKQFSIEMISKITELYILCGDIQVSTEKKNSLVLKWFQKWQNHAFFVETFMFQLNN